MVTVLISRQFFYIYLMDYTSLENGTNDMACGNFHILEVADAMFQQVSGFSSRYIEVWESWNCSFLCLLRRQQLEG